MEISEIIEKLNEAILHESWDIVLELVGELEAENEFTDPFEDYENDEF
jgi:hypothetical protein